VLESALLMPPELCTARNNPLLLCIKRLHFAFYYTYTYAQRSMKQVQREQQLIKIQSIATIISQSRSQLNHPSAKQQGANLHAGDNSLGALPCAAYVYRTVNIKLQSRYVTKMRAKKGKTA
jgi:hypothetical protein